jgi:replicative DNA helicase
LATLPPEQLPVAEQLLRGGIPAVRAAVAEQNKNATAQGRATIDPVTIDRIAEDLLGRTNLAMWKDRAAGSIAAGRELRLRDLRAVVTSAKTVSLDDEARAQLKELQASLTARLETLRTQWAEKLEAAIEASNPVTSLELVIRPPDMSTRVSAEMAAEEIGQRVAAVVGEVPLEGLRNGRLDERGWGRLDRAHRVLGNVPLDLMDRAAPTAGEVRMRAKAVQARKGLGLLVVDYLQLLQHDRAERHELAVGQAAWAFKTLARDLQCPVILLSQLNRGCEARSDKRPMLSDLRDSGQLEQHADVVLFLYRDEVYNPQSPDAGTAEVLVAKNRSGPTSTCKLAFLGTQARFASLDTHHSEPRF